MKKTAVMVIIYMVFSAIAYGKAYETQEYLNSPSRDDWYVYIDFTLSVYEDLYVRSYSVEDSTFLPDPKAPFIVDNDNDLSWKANDFMFGFSHVIIDQDEYGALSWYIGGGSNSTSLELFPSGVMGVKGWIIETGIQGDVHRYGNMLENGFAIDCSFRAITASGSGGAAGIDEDYKLTGVGLSAAFYHTAKVEMMDTTDTVVYIGGLIDYARTWIELDVKTSGGSGTARYAMENQLVNQVYIVLGSKFYWDTQATTADVRFIGSLDGSYAMSITILQTF